MFNLRIQYRLLSTNHTRKLVYQLRTNCPKSLSTSFRTLQTFTQQETITPCLLFILQSIYLHNLSPHMSSCIANRITYLPTATLSTDQSNRSPEFLNFQLTYMHYHLTLKMASAQVVETSVTNNSPFQDSYHPDDLFQSRLFPFIR